MRIASLFILFALALGSLSACGVKGPLTYPGQPAAEKTGHK